MLVPGVHPEEQRGTARTDLSKIMVGAGVPSTQGREKRTRPPAPPVAVTQSLPPDLKPLVGTSRVVIIVPGKHSFVIWVFSLPLFHEFSCAYLAFVLYKRHIT